jgi:predicted  nucleic acid-binding Zn-ribbon protein
LDNLGQKNKLNEEEIMNYNKKIDSLNSVKNELNSQISILNNELEKTNDISFKCVNLERENRKFLEEISSLKLEIDNLNFKLSINKSENNETKQIMNNNLKPTILLTNEENTMLLVNNNLNQISQINNNNNSNTNEQIELIIPDIIK